jgi:hypothetical protein
MERNLEGNRKCFVWPEMMTHNIFRVRIKSGEKRKETQMTKKLFEEAKSEKNGIVALGAVSNKEGLKPSGHIRINPPPNDGKCEVCGRHMSQLDPFGGPGDPLVGDFSGELLVKRYRRVTVRNEDGRENSNVYASWECRNCCEIHSSLGDEDAHIQGSGAEIAFAKLLSSGRTQRPQRRDFFLRQNDRRDGGLIVMPDDDPDHVYVLLVGRIPTFHVAGWVYGKEAKQERYIVP